MIHIQQFISILFGEDLDNTIPDILKARQLEIA